MLDAGQQSSTNSRSLNKVKVNVIVICQSHRRGNNFGLAVGLEWLQQLFDVITEEGYVMRTHVYRVRDAEDAYTTLQRIDNRRSDEKRLLLDLPTKECERLIEMEVWLNFCVKIRNNVTHAYFLQKWWWGFVSNSWIIFSAKKLWMLNRRCRRSLWRCQTMWQAHPVHLASKWTAAIYAGAMVLVAIGAGAAAK